MMKIDTIINKILDFLGSEDRKWLFILGVLNILLFYFPPVDLIHEIIERNSECLWPMIFIPFLVSFALFILFLTKKMRKLFQVLFGVIIPLGLIVFLIFDSFACYGKTTISAEATEVNKEVTKIDTVYVEKPCNCYSVKENKRLSVRYIPQVVIEKSELVILNIFSITNEIDTVSYEVNIYPFKSNLLLPAYYSVTPILNKNSVTTFTRRFFTAVKKRMNYLYFAFQRVVIRDKNAPSAYFNDFEGIELPNGFLNSIDNYIQIIKSYDIEEPINVAEILDFKSFTHRVNEFLPATNKNEVIYRMNSSTDENKIFDSEELRDSINNLKNSLSLLEKEISSYDLSEFPESNKRIELDLKKRLYGSELEILILRESLEEKMMLLNDLSTRLEECEISKNKMAGSLVDNDGFSKFLTIERTIAKYEYRGKTILVEDNSTHRKKQINSFSIVVDREVLEVGNSIGILSDDKTASTFRRIRDCGNETCEVSLPNYFFTNISDKKEIVIAIKSQEDEYIRLLTFNVE